MSNLGLFFTVFQGEITNVSDLKNNLESTFTKFCQILPKFVCPSQKTWTLRKPNYFCFESFSMLSDHYFGLTYWCLVVSWQKQMSLSLGIEKLTVETEKCFLSRLNLLQRQGGDVLSLAALKVPIYKSQGGLSLLIVEWGMGTTV